MKTVYGFFVPWAFLFMTSWMRFRLVPSGHHTEETEFGLFAHRSDPRAETVQLERNPFPLDLLPTPNAMDIAHRTWKSTRARAKKSVKKGKTDHSLGLEDMAVAQLLPTPTALDKGGGRIIRRGCTKRSYICPRWGRSENEDGRCSDCCHRLHEHI